jgi:hypothetical protein
MHPMELLQLALVATATQHGMLEQHKWKGYGRVRALGQQT